MLLRPTALLVAAFAFAMVEGCSAADSSRAPSPEPIGTSSAAITSTDVLSRAEQWVTAKLLYCQSANHQPDYDTSCSSTCTRQDNPQWDPYRSDCSGFVSWAWGLPAPGRVTGTFAPFDTTVSKTIQAIDLQPGDAVNLTSGGHIMLFVQWITKGSEAQFYEEPGCSSSTPYAHSLTSAVTLSGTQIDVAWSGETFTAIRFDSITNDAPPTGSLDGAACDAITGWAQDPDSKTTPLEVDLTFDAPTGQPGAGTVTQTANISRADLCTAIGSCTQAFNVATPVSLLDGTKHTVYAYAKDAQTGTLQELPASPKTFTCAPPAIPSGIRRHVPSPAVMTSWKFNAFLDVAKEPLTALQALPVGPDFPAAPEAVISDDGSPEVWVIDTDEGGTQVRRHVITPASLTAWQLAATKWTAAKLDAVKQGIDWPALPFVAQGTGDPAVYVVDAAPGSTPPPKQDGGSGTNSGDTNTGGGGGCNASNQPRSDGGWMLALGLLALSRRRK